jgi:hypothetical protein
VSKRRGPHGSRVIFVHCSLYASRAPIVKELLKPAAKIGRPAKLGVVQNVVEILKLDGLAIFLHGVAPKGENQVRGAGRDLFRPRFMGETKRLCSRGSYGRFGTMEVSGRIGPNR